MKTYQTLLAGIAVFGLTVGDAFCQNRGRTGGRSGHRDESSVERQRSGNSLRSHSESHSHSNRGSTHSGSRSSDRSPRGSAQSGHNPWRPSGPTGGWDWENKRPMEGGGRPARGEVGAQILMGVLEGLSNLPKRPNRNGSHRHDQSYYEEEVSVYVPVPAPSTHPVVQTRPAVSRPPAIPKNTLLARSFALTANDINLPQGGLQIMSATDYAAIGSAVTEVVSTRLADLEASLKTLGIGDTSAVRAAVEELKRSTDQGLPITDDALAKLDESISAAMSARGLNFSPMDVSRISGILGAMQVASQVSAMFAAAYTSGSGVLGLDADMTDLATIPGLPDDQMYCLPDGGIVTGCDAGENMTYGQASTADVLDMPIGNGDPTAGSLTGAALGAQSGVIVINPAESQTALQFQFLGSNYSVEPGAMRLFAEGASRVIEFDRGDGRAARYTLSDGSYAFTIKDGKSDLQQRSFSAMISNSGNDSPFHYVVDNESRTLAAGQQAEHQSRYPLVFKFNRGRDGADAERSFIEANLTLQRALNPKDQLWDLFDAKDVSQPKASSKIGVTLGSLEVLGELKEDTANSPFNGFLDAKDVAILLDTPAKKSTAKPSATKKFDLDKFKSAMRAKK